MQSCFVSLTKCLSAAVKSKRTAMPDKCGKEKTAVTLSLPVQG